MFLAVGMCYCIWLLWQLRYYNDVIIGMMGSQITGVLIVYSTICSSTDQRKHQSSVSLAIMGGIHQWLMNSLHKGPVTWKMFPFDDVFMVGFIMIDVSHLVIFHCSTERHTVHTMFSWPNPKQWLMIRISDLMIIVRWSKCILTIMRK